MSPRFEWDAFKASSNIHKHGVSFETAQRVFADPFAIIEQDRIEGFEYRWRALGNAGGVTILMVAHTVQEDDVETIRIISARPADRAERRKYEKQHR